MKTGRLICLAFALSVAPSVEAASKPPAAKETVVMQRVAIPGTARELGMGIAEFPPYAVKPRHKAKGPEVCYVLEGEVILEVAGRPSEIIHAGETFQIPANVIHTTSAGPEGAKVIASWVHTPGEQFNYPESLSK